MAVLVTAAKQRRTIRSNHSAVCEIIYPSTFLWEFGKGGDCIDDREGQVSSVGGDAVRGRKVPASGLVRPVNDLSCGSRGLRLVEMADCVNESVAAARIAEPDDVAVIFGKRIGLHRLARPRGRSH